MKTAILTGLLAAVAVCAPATEDEIRNVEKNWAATVTSGNHAALERLLADRLIYAHASGAIETKSVYLGRLRSGDMKYDRIEHEDITVRVYGEAAVAHSKVRILGKSNARAFDDRLMMLHVWVKQGGRWQLAAHQTTRLQ